MARQNLEQTKLKVANKVLQLAADVQTAFYALQAQVALVGRLNVILEVNEAAADLARRQYDAGNINELELHNQQAASVESRLELIEARSRVRTGREHLNRLLGLSGDQINWQIADALPLLPEKELPLKNLESLAVKQRLDLAFMRGQTNSLAAALRLKGRTRFFPGIIVGVDTERFPEGQRILGPTLDLELPLFDQGQPAIARLSAELEQARDNYAAQEINVRSEVREARDALTAAREAAEYCQKSLLPLRQKILGETLLHYNAMQKSSYDLLAVKEREQIAEQKNVEALRDYWIARVALERAVGGRLTNEPNPQSNVERSKP